MARDQGECRRVELPGGRSLRVRPMVPADADSLVALFAAFDEQDLYARFFTAHPPPAQLVERMVRVGGRGGAGLVAVVGDAAGGEVVAEASYEPLGNGDGELGIAVARAWRGWLGPYLLDVLLATAARAGVGNLEADVLVANRPMLALLRARGHAVIRHDDGPATVRVVIGTHGAAPSWPAGSDRPRLLVEAPGRWPAEAAARRAGAELRTCPRPLAGARPCPAIAGRCCPLAAGADLIVVARADPVGERLREAHRRWHGGVPVVGPGQTGPSALQRVGGPAEDGSGGDGHAE